MTSCCKNRLSINYTCKDAIEDLEIAIQKAREQRNKEEPRSRSKKWSISRKW